MTLSRNCPQQLTFPGSFAFSFWFLCLFVVVLEGFCCFVVVFALVSFSLSQATKTSNADFRIAAPGLFACLLIFRMQIDFIIQNSGVYISKSTEADHNSGNKNSLKNLILTPSKNYQMFHFYILHAQHQQSELTKCCKNKRNKQQQQQLQLSH